MWWTRILHRAPAPPMGAVRHLERVISPAESHSAKPFRVLTATEPAGARREYRIKRDNAKDANKPNPAKQCF